MTESTVIILVAAIPTTIASLTAAAVALAALKRGHVIEAKTDSAAEVQKQAAEMQKVVLTKVDGNYSDLKSEVAAAKSEVVLANQRIAVLIERLITSTPANAGPAVVINGVTKNEP